MSNADKRFEDLARFRKARAELMPINRTAILDALSSAKISRVLVEFDGCGDGGQITEINPHRDGEIVALPEGRVTYIEAEWAKAEPTRKELPLAEAIEAFSYCILEECHQGWEDNEGAFGVFVFDVTSGKVQLEFNARVIESLKSVDWV